MELMGCEEGHSYGYAVHACKEGSEGIVRRNC